MSIHNSIHNLNNILQTINLNKILINHNNILKAMNLNKIHINLYKIIRLHQLLCNQATQKVSHTLTISVTQVLITLSLNKIKFIIWPMNTDRLMDGEIILRILNGVFLGGLFKELLLLAGFQQLTQD